MCKLAKRYFDGQGFLKDGMEDRLESFIERVKRTGHEIRCREDVRDFVAQLRDQTERRNRIDREFPGANGSPLWKKLLNASLYSYQKEGALFAARTGRCIIADDMGLGKTIQAIAAVEILARAMGVERILVICPTSLKHQWKQEIERFSGRSAEVVEGLLTKRIAIYHSESFYKIVNYEVIHQDRKAIECWDPELIVLDEAQRIKNWKTRRAKSVKQLKSEYAIVLTGTPLENRLEELHSIVEFVDRFHLGPLFRFLAEHQETDPTGRVIGYRNLSKISHTLEPILVRRHKDTVLKQLPERLDKRYFLPMTEQQWSHHEENREIVGRIVKKWRRYGFLSEQDQRRLMIALQFMRMSCNSTYLLDPETDHGYKADEVVPCWKKSLEQQDAKVVIFSQWLGTH
jgi:SNF2 family DNA or RNA helicase